MRCAFESLLQQTSDLTRIYVSLKVCYNNNIMYPFLIMSKCFDFIAERAMTKQLIITRCNYYLLFRLLAVQTISYYVICILYSLSTSMNDIVQIKIMNFIFKVKNRVNMVNIVNVQELLHKT